MEEFSPAIRVENLRKVYGDKAAVDGLTLTVPRGSFFGFLGPNGAGKTTTIKMLMGLAPPTSGSIELLGLPMPDRALDIKQRIGLVPDESLLFDYLTGAEFVEFAGRIYGLDRTVARERAAEVPHRYARLGVRQGEGAGHQQQTGSREGSHGGSRAAHPPQLVAPAARQAA